MSVRPELRTNVLDILICDASQVADLKEVANGGIPRLPVNTSAEENHPVSRRRRGHHFPGLSRVWARLCPANRSTPPLLPPQWAGWEEWEGRPKWLGYWVGVRLGKEGDQPSSTAILPRIVFVRVHLRSRLLRQPR